MVNMESPQASDQERIDRLEKQVAGLMSTVLLLHEKMRLGSMKIPRPDAYMQANYPDLAAKKTLATGEATDGDSGTKAIQNRKGNVGTVPADVVPIDLSKLEPFQYSPLNPHTSEVRVISFVPGKQGNELFECEISTISLPQSRYDPKSTKFMPLSYTWGGLDRSERIVVSGKSFMVTKNLHTALKHFRDTDLKSLTPPGYSNRVPSATLAKLVPKHWWIDAICINQDDLDERKNQVALMTRLYRFASIVHVWLGEEADDSSRAMDLVKKLCHKASDQEQREAVQRYAGQTHRMLGPGLAPEKFPDEPAPLPEEERLRNYQAMVKLFQREWFSRVWILQEMALPQAVSIHCGNQICNWDDMRKTTSLLVYVADEYMLPSLQQPNFAIPGSLYSPFQRVEQLTQLREMVQSRLASRDPYLSIRTVLLFANNANATDLRDKVFAILPLVSPEATRLVADYRQSRFDIYRSTALNLAESGLDFLSACQHSKSTNPELPSWVPDFSQKWKHHPMVVTLPPKVPVEETEKNSINYVPETATLTVKGYIIDTLASTCNSSVTFNPSRREVAEVKSDWESYIAKNDIDGENRRKSMDDLEYGSSGYATYAPTFRPAYVEGKSEHLDLSINTLCRHLVTSSQESDWDKDKKLGWYRHFLIGRRLMRTEGRCCGVVSADAAPGDKVVKFQGSEFIFIIRESGPGKWIIIGDTYFLGHYSNYVIEHMHPKPSLQDIELV